MTLELLSARCPRSMNRYAEGDAEAEAPDDRLQLIELAVCLQQLPARNLVYRTALDRTANDLVKMAGCRVG